MYTTDTFQKYQRKRNVKSYDNEECKQHSRKGMHKQEWAKVRSGKRDAEGEMT